MKSLFAVASILVGFDPSGRGPAGAGRQTDPPRRVFRISGSHMDEIDYLDIKAGDRFMLYESTGELVIDTFDVCVAWEALEDARLREDGTPGVSCVPVKDTFYDVPRNLNDNAEQETA